MKLLTKEQILKIVKVVCPDFDTNDDLQWRIEMVLRRKENPTNKASFRVIDRRYANTTEELYEFMTSKMENIGIRNDMINLYNQSTNGVLQQTIVPRIYLSGKPFRKSKVAPEMLQRISENLQAGHSIHRKIYDHIVVRRSVTTGNKLWMIDYDSNDLIKYINIITELLKVTEVVAEYDTKNGKHIIIKPFDKHKLNSIDGWNVDFKITTPKCCCDNENCSSKKERGSFYIKDNEGNEVFDLKLFPSYLVAYL